MRKHLLNILFVGFSIIGFAQNSAMLISLNGEGIVKQASKKTALKLPMTFVDGDMISMQKGTAEIMYFSGEEMIISTVKDYIIQKPKSDLTSSALMAMTHSGTSDNLLAQSGNVYEIRGVKHVFPTKSKLHVRTDSIQLVFKFKDSTDLNLELHIKESKMQKEVYHQLVTDTIVKISSDVLEAGKTYHWSVTGTSRGMPELGVIVALPISDQLYMPQSKFEYLDVISRKYESGLFFSALSFCIEAKKKFPETTVFDLMYENLLR